jgi:type IV pilus assembly protein PilV
MTEVLIAVFVLSVGLLGIAGLQLTSLKSTHASAMRSQATYLAYDIIDRMRANNTVAVAGGYDIAETADPLAGSVAGSDLATWRAAIARTLPAADRDGNGTPDPAPGSIATDLATRIVTVTIAWGELSDDPANQAGKRPVVRSSIQTQLQ